MRFVPIKTDDQLDLQALHRVRDRWVARRTAVMNQMRGFLMERGITIRKWPSPSASRNPNQFCADPGEQVTLAPKGMRNDLRARECSAEAWTEPGTDSECFECDRSHRAELGSGQRDQPGCTRRPAIFANCCPAWMTTSWLQGKKSGSLRRLRRSPDGLPRN